MTKNTNPHTTYKKLKNLCIGMFFLVLLFGNGSTYSQGIVSIAGAGYRVYQADLNSDGCIDYLIKAPDIFIPIALDDELYFPIMVPSVKLPVLLTSTGSCQYNSTLPTRAQVTDARWTLTDIPITVGDVLGNGSGSILFAPKGQANPTAFNLVSASGGGFALLQTFVLNNITLDANITVNLEYADGDSRSDLVLRTSGQVLSAFTAGIDGKFMTGASDSVALATAIWNTFTSTLKSATPLDALQSVSVNTRDMFATQLNLPNSTPAVFANSVLSFDVLSTTSTYIEAAIVVSENGQSELYFVIIGPDPDGVWRIYSF